MRPMKDVHAALDDAHAMRHADRELLSLALMHARNRTLAWLGALEGGASQSAPGLMPAWWLAGRAAWFQERWIARNVQRARGAQADRSRTPLASIEPQADRWWAQEPPSVDGTPDSEVVRSYLSETLEVTLDLLASADASDDALHWYRAALFEEDALVLRFAALAQATRNARVRPLVAERVLRPVRAPLWFAAQRWQLGSPPGGYVPAAEHWAHEEPVPEFEIDAQPVTWQQYAEFVQDGGYDDPALWSDAGAAWLQAEGRRTPRDVEQVRHGVLVQRFGTLVRAPMGEAACMLSWHEADAWCRWAGRRLPTELEWELATSLGASRGVTWGDVPEWTAGRARAWPGGVATWDSTLRVQRGGAWFEPRRVLHPKSRRFLTADSDTGFAGFRSCAI
jgi:formylglycine-generating enzyme required for sulfatase activity